ncbi:MAG: acyl-CoA dehydrogenase family protein [Actinobacteria bacterium]|nr:acyl-CoA dehydrogenase family protein [Actinomycetota bacterium]
MKRDIFEEEHDAFRDAVRTFLTRSVVPRYDEFTRTGVPREVWLEAGAQGFLGPQVPQTFGGGGVDDYRFNAILTEELAAVSAALASQFQIQYDVVAPYLLELATDEQKQRWLPRFCTGELITAIAMTEPAGGSDLAALETRAERTDDGWVINGSKTFITNGSIADLVIVAARTDATKGSRGITLFAIEAGTPGFDQAHPLRKIGQHEADTSELFLTAVTVTDDAVLGQVDRGFVHLMERLAQERLGTAIASLSHARAIFAETLDHAKQRHAFGQPIGSLQHNKFQLAELQTLADVTQAFLDRCITSHTDGGLSPVDAAKAKWWAADVQGRILDVCLQLHGGYGFMWEYRAARAWVDGRVARIWAGTNEVMKEIIGRDLGL